jgi:hypothetical protein
MLRLNSHCLDYDNATSNDGMSFRFLTLIPAVGIAALLCGCPNANMYTTPRTTPNGHVTHTIAPEVISWSAKTKTTTNSSGQVVTETESITLPTAPSYHARVGLGDNIDLGIKALNLSSLAADLKINFIKGDSFDMAVAPGVQYFGIFSGGNSAHAIYGHLPLLLGINLGETLTFVLTPGVTYALFTGSTSGDSSQSRLATADGLMGRFGVGLNIRLSKGFAIHPEVSAMRMFKDTENLFITAGIGFQFGKLPFYGKEEVPPAAKPPPPAP